jgi:poly(3-hydroxyalkanoate) synthetase
MVSPINTNVPEPQDPRPQSENPPINYSKLKVAAVFLTFIPVMAAWTVLVIICLPLKAWNWVQKCRGREQIHCVNAMIHEYFALIALVVRYPCSKKYHFTPGVGKPILLVHGYLHNASGWYKMIDYMKEKNLGPIYAIDLGDGSVSGKFWPIERYAKQVAARALEIATETGRNDIDFVGHSMGGLVVMKAASLMAHNTVSSVTTLGSPLRGTAISPCVANGLNCQDMLEGSVFLKDLEAEIDDLSSRVKIHHIASSNDPLVPEKSAYLGEIGADNILLADIGHAGLLTSDTSADLVIGWLSGVDRETDSSQ